MEAPGTDAVPPTPPLGAVPGADFLTVMWPCDGSPVAKRLFLDPQDGLTIRSEPAKQAMWFSAGQVQVQDFAGMAAALDGLAQGTSHFLVRGQLKPGVNPDALRRTHVGDESSLSPHPHQWVLLDLDKYQPDLTPEQFTADIPGWAARAREDLPPAFHTAKCWYQATGSAGVKPGCRLRLAFWLDRHVSDQEWKTWTESWQVPIDRSLFTPSQPHFMSAPILVDGLVDPVPGARTGVLDGPEDLVRIAGLEQVQRSGPALDELAKVARNISRTPEGERRNALNRAAFGLASAYAPDELPDEAIDQALVLAAQKCGLTGFEIQVTIRNGLRDGRAKHMRDREGWRRGLSLDKAGNPRATAANVSQFLSNHPALAGLFAWNERALAPVWLRENQWGRPVGAWVDDADVTRLVEWFQTQAHLDVKAHWVQAGLDKAVQANSYDPVQLHLSQLADWDDTDRIDTFFIRHWGVEDTALTRAESRCWFLQAIRRAFATLDQPVQADYVLVLGGPQGLRKSSGLRALCPDARFFNDVLPDLASKDAKMAAVSSWIIELAELRQRKSDRDAFKAFLSCQVDRFRLPYGHREVAVPRRCVFAATVNETDFLTDPTGNRRFWPMVCTKRADLEAIRAERDQLWAEALSRAQAGELAYLTRAQEKEATQIEEAHREESVAESRLARFQDLGRVMTGPLSGITLEAWQITPDGTLTGLRLAQVNDLIGVDARSTGVVQALRALKWRHKRELFGSVKVRYWAPPVPIMVSGDQLGILKIGAN